MKKIFLTFSLLLLTESAIAQWTKLPFPSSDNLYSVAFCNADTGFVVTEDSLYRTTNGGQSWTPSVASPYLLYDVCVPKQTPNSGTVYAVGGYLAFDLTNLTQEVHHIILKTTNFGESWTQQIDLSTIGPSVLAYTYFLNDSVGFVNGTCGPFIANNGFRRTTDGGATWAVMNGAGTSVYSGSNVDFINETLAYANGNGGGVLKTTDQGKNWIGIAFDQGKKVDFTDEQNGYRIAGGIDYTTDGGQTWLPSADSSVSRFNEDVSDLRFANDSIGYVIGYQGDIFKTNDGYNWQRQQSSTTNFLNKIAVIDSVRLYVVGNAGTILKTTNGGTLSTPSQASQPFTFRLEQNYPNPFNPTTTIKYELSSTQQVLLKVYDLLGRKVASLVNERQPAGKYQIRFDASNLSSGIYFYTLQTNTTSQTKKMLLMK